MKDYISLLDKDDLKIICTEIGVQELRRYYQKESAAFSQIRRGFRPKSISDEDIIKISMKYADRDFIAEFINGKIEEWVGDVDTIFSDNKSADDKEQALAASLNRHSFFVQYPRLFFKLCDKDFSESFISDVIALLSVERDGEKLQETETANAESLRERVSELEKTLEKTSTQLKEMSQLATHLEEIEDELEQKDFEISKLKQLITYSDIDTNSYLDTEYMHISFCEVTEPDYNDRQWLIRLADVDAKGNVNIFYFDEDQPPYFENRFRLYFSDGPTEPGAVGIWDWSAIANKSGLGTDYIESKFNPRLSLVEIIEVPDCYSMVDLINALEEGVGIKSTSDRMLLSYRNDSGTLVGLHCRADHFEKRDGLFRLKKNITQLPEYIIGVGNRVYLDNGCFYYDKISLGTPNEIVRVKDPLEVVKNLIFERSTWQAFKEKGVSRNEWRIIRDFFNMMETDTVVDDIMTEYGCSEIEAEKLLSEFKDTAYIYLNGETVEDNIISAVISTDDDLLSRAKSLIREEWEEENKEELRKKSIELDLKSEELLTVEEKVAKAREEYEDLVKKSSQIDSDIRTKEQLAEDVERGIAKRIEDARKNAADFIANMAFSVPIQGVSKDQTQKRLFKPGYLFETESNIINTWEELLDTLQQGLIASGVSQDQARHVAAYLYASYLNDTPVLLAGPNSSEIADAFSAAICNQTAATLELGDEIDNSLIKSIIDSDYEIVKITNPFHPYFVNRIPDIIEMARVEGIFLFFVHPYIEDLQIEPNSLFHYMVPLFTEAFVDAKPSGFYIGGKITEEFEHFNVQDATVGDRTISGFKIIRIPALAKENIRKNIIVMDALRKHKVIADHDILFGLLPYAYATLQLDQLNMVLTQMLEKNQGAIKKRKVKEYLKVVLGDFENE